MSMSILRAAYVAAFVLVASSAHAEGVKAGLWEINMKMQSSNPETAKAMEKARQQIASMPPEQRKMMEDMMAKQGVAMPKMGNDGMLVKVCLTAEMARQKQLPVHQDSNCSSNASPLVGGKSKVSMSCTNPPMTGVGEITFNGDTGYSMKMTTTSGNQGGSMTMDAAGKWVGANCGDIKPVSSTLKK